MAKHKTRLDQYLAEKRLVSSRSQAESYIKLGKVYVDGQIITKAGALVSDGQNIRIAAGEQYVSRAALKLASVTEILGINFRDKVVLDVGSSTGGFTDYVLRHGAAKVVAVDVGSEQLHPKLRDDPRIDLREKTDIRQVEDLTPKPDIILLDLSFISLRQILPHVVKLTAPKTQIVPMVKPQFEAGKDQINRGIVKNDKLRRQILKDFENWANKLFIIQKKADSQVAGAGGNLERFYLLKSLKNKSKN